MQSTSASLLDRLRESPNEDSWGRFVDLYVPLLYNWGHSKGLDSTDAADLVQEVLKVLVVKLPSFQYDPKRGFRGWLYRITANKANDFFRRKSRVAMESIPNELLDSGSPSEADAFGEKQYRGFLVARARTLIESEFDARTWKACWLHITEKRSAQDIGTELGLSANAVRVAKCRVLRRLREELEGLLD